MSVNSENATNESEPYDTEEMNAINNLVLSELIH